eukprot:Tbor_TRINITY_DN5845_c0_g1::TRINITY_DN5845_c0_g1_i1::g.6520::m.6520/K03358/APC11; anaphase-promoting complex subunit 11
MSVEITKIQLVAKWVWDIPSDETSTDKRNNCESPMHPSSTDDEVCGICRLLYTDSCPNCKIPGDDCPLATGKCRHTFHIHCIEQWTAKQKLDCPLCRQVWDYI